MMEWVVILGFLILAVLMALVLLRLRLDRADRQELAQLRLRAGDYDALVVRQGEQEALIRQLQEERARLQADLRNQEQVAAEKMAVLQQAESRLKMEFENLATKIFEDRGRILSERHQDQLGSILQPLKEQLASFRSRVDDLHQQSSDYSIRLFEQIQSLQALSGKVSEDANQLALAIKGNAKTQGDWGEVIVERIFEAAGLERDRDYRVQDSLYDADGQIKRPDFIVHLPQNKSVIVDAKVSLTAYERYHSATADEDKVAALAEHVRSVRRHIDQLKAKDYASLMGNRTLDFVVLCIPLESAYQAAMQADPKLMYDVAQTQVVITGPTTLMITLKLIVQMWRRENENKNAEKIATLAGGLYDKVSGIVHSVEEARKRLSSTSESFDKVMNQLQTGRGNLIGKVEQLRKLGAKVNKPLPQDLLVAAMPGDEAGKEEDHRSEPAPSLLQAEGLPEP